MVEESYSATEPARVHVERRRGFSDVWLRKNIRRDTDDRPEGPVDFWACDEVHFTVPERLTEEEAEDRFDDLWDEHEDDGMAAEDIAKSARAAASEAKMIAKEGDPAVASFISLALPSVAPTAKDSAIAPVLKYAPDYVPDGHAYKKGDVFRYGDGTYWRVSQGFTTQAHWKPGDAGLTALFYQITIAPDGIIVWEQPTGEFDAPDAGDLRHYPDADGPVYRSKVNDNGYSPDAAPANWEKA